MARIDVAVGVIRDKAGCILIAKRKKEAHQGGLWEFPGGKIEATESVEQALNRELYEELAMQSKASISLINIQFSYPECDVHLHVREVQSFDGEPIGSEGQEIKWVSEEELDDYQFPEANKAILSAIRLGRDYAIIGAENERQLLQQLEYVAEQNISLVQLRVKNLHSSLAEEIIKAARIKCKQLNIRYLLNSQMCVEKHLGEGLHLTSSDLMNLKQRPSDSGMMAASCHSLNELRQAEALGLDFAVLSPVMQTSSHPEAIALGWDQAEAWIAEVNIPVFALGGMLKQDRHKAIISGAQGIAGISLYL